MTYTNPNWAANPNFRIGPNGELPKMQTNQSTRNSTTFADLTGDWRDSIGVAMAPTGRRVGKQLNPELAALLQSIIADSGNMRRAQNASALIRSSGAQAGSNAATAYARRNQQLGLDASAAGAVDAQVRLPYLRQASEVDLATQAADWERKLKAQSTAADIMGRMDSLRLDYAKTLEDFNQRELDRQQQQTQWQQGFDADAESRRLANEERQLAIEAAKRAKQTQMAEAKARETFDPGYIPTFGPMRMASGSDPRINRNTVYTFNPYNNPTGKVLF